MPQNQAAWLTVKGVPLTVGTADMPQAGPNEIVVKNHALAINPIDAIQATTGRFVKKMPAVLGNDLAGEVYEVGSNVTRFKKGDRVVGRAWQMRTGEAEDGAFALYTKVDARNAAPLPAHISYTDAAVFPLGVDTATAALYQSSQLGLELPTTHPSPTGRAIVIYGGSSSIGLCAAQLARGSGVRVISIASPHNFDLCKTSGADDVFDYKSPALVADVLAALGKEELVGIFNAICGEDSWTHSFGILEALGGGKIAASKPPPENLPVNVRATQVFGLGEYAFPIWEEFLGPALANGQVKPLPEPLVVGKGLESVQAALDRHSAGVSGQKVVIEL